MKVPATFHSEAYVNPYDFLRKMIEDELGFNQWLIEENGKYYIERENSFGSHSSYERTEISKERYDYIKALQTALNYLKNFLGE